MAEAGEEGKGRLRQLRALKGSHDGAVLAVRFTHDGRYCLSCGKDRSIRLWNPTTGLHIKAYMAHGREVRDVAVSRDNARLASCGAEKSVLLWDVASGRVLRRMKGHDNQVNAVKFNSLDTVIVSGGYDRCVKVWDCRSNSTDAIQAMDPFDDAVMSVALTDQHILASSVDGSLCTFDMRMGRMLRDDMGKECPINCVQVSNDRNCILAACLQSVCRLLDWATGELLNDYSGHINEHYKVEACFSNDDSLVISGSEDGRIVLWDLVEASILAKEKGHEGTVTGLSFHPTEPLLLSCSVDGTCVLWAVKMPPQ